MDRGQPIIMKKREPDIRECFLCNIVIISLTIGSFVGRNKMIQFVVIPLSFCVVDESLKVNVSKGQSKEQTCVVRQQMQWSRGLPTAASSCTFMEFIH